jgi:hypothetical protein
MLLTSYVPIFRDEMWHDVMMEVKTSIRHHMPCLRSLSLSSVEQFYCRIVDWVVRTHDSADPLALDDEEDDDYIGWYDGDTDDTFLEECL